MSVLPVQKLALLINEYPDTPNHTLAHRYGVTIGAVERLAHTNQLHKTPDRTRSQARRAAAAQAEADFPPRPPVAYPAYPAPTYCKGCGLTHRHWPGCPRIGTDRRPTFSPT